MPLISLSRLLALFVLVFVGLSTHRAHAQGAVAPSCPSGYVLSGSKCLPAAPAPSCPSGFVFSGSRCVPSAPAAPAPSTAAIPADARIFITKKALGVKSATELDGAAICLVGGSPSEAAVKRYFRIQQMSYTGVVVGSADAATKSYQNGSCDALIVESGRAASLLASLTPANAHRILPESLGCVVCAPTPASPPTAIATPAPTPAYPSAPPGCPPAWVLPNGGCAGTPTPSPAPAAPVRRAAPTPTYTAPPVRRAAPIRRAAREGDLEYDLQEELKYIGCYTGSLDGIWGPRSQSALNRFIDLVGTSYARKPSQYVLDAVRNEKKGFCKPVRVAPKRTKPKGCRSGTVFLEGQCIRRSEVASFCGPGAERSGSKCVSMGDASGCLNKCERRLTTCQGNINEDEDEVICMNKFDLCNQSC